jgi:hypothetical protein
MGKMSLEIHQCWYDNMNQYTKEHGVPQEDVVALAFYKKQIDKAKEAGMEGFDRAKFMVKKGMRTLLIWVLLSTAAYGVDVDTLRAQKESIENDEAAREELLSGLKSIIKWAVDGQSAEDARSCVDLTATAMSRYWGEDSAALLKKRLNGMISVVNREVRWLGTPKRLQALKAELLQEKEQAIENIVNPPKPEAVEVIDYKTIYVLVDALKEARDSAQASLDAKKTYDAKLATNVAPYKWQVTGKLSSMTQTDEIATFYLHIADPKKQVQGDFTYQVHVKNINPEWKKDGIVTVVGDLTYRSAIRLYLMGYYGPATTAKHPSLQSSKCLDLIGLALREPGLLDMVSEKAAKQVR